MFQLWSLVVSYHKGAKPWIWNVVSSPDYISYAHWKNGSAQLPIPFSLKCARLMLAHCYLLLTLDIIKNCTPHCMRMIYHQNVGWSLIGNCQITHTISCIINNERSTIKSQLFSVVTYEAQSLVTTYSWPRTLVHTGVYHSPCRFNLPLTEHDKFHLATSLRNIIILAETVCTEIWSLWNRLQYSALYIYAPGSDSYWRQQNGGKS